MTAFPLVPADVSFAGHRDLLYHKVLIHSHPSEAIETESGAYRVQVPCERRFLCGFTHGFFFPQCRLYCQRSSRRLQKDENLPLPSG